MTWNILRGYPTKLSNSTQPKLNLFWNQILLYVANPRLSLHLHSLEVLIINCLYYWHSPMPLNIWISWLSFFWILTLQVFLSYLVSHSFPMGGKRWSHKHSGPILLRLVKGQIRYTHRHRGLASYNFLHEIKALLVSKQNLITQCGFRLHITRFIPLFCKRNTTC